MQIKCNIWIYEKPPRSKRVFSGYISWMPFPGMTIILNDCGYKISYIYGMPETNEIEVMLDGEDPTNFLPKVPEID